MKQLILSLIVLFGTLSIQAQDTANNVQQATGLRADGKIYVVIVVAATILLGLFLYVFRLDRKITKLEKQSS
jgi:CcmD family protein